MTPEAKVKRYLKEQCEARGWWCLALQVSLKGWPDRTILGPDAHCAFVELKAEGVRHSKAHLARQARRRSELRGLGFVARKATGNAEVDAVINEIEEAWGVGQ